MGEMDLVDRKINTIKQKLSESDSNQMRFRGDAKSFVRHVGFAIDELQGSHGEDANFIDGRRKIIQEMSNQAKQITRRRPDTNRDLETKQRVFNQKSTQMQQWVSLDELEFANNRGNHGLLNNRLGRPNRDISNVKEKWPIWDRKIEIASGK